MTRKVRNELKEFKEFKKSYNFKSKEVSCVEDNFYCDGLLIKDEKGNQYGETEKWVNVGFKLHGSFSQTLSNLFPYQIKFRGKNLNSLEGVFQGIKFHDKKSQNLVFKYFGTQAVHIKIAANNDFKVTHKLYWQGEEINRFSETYDDFIDELYISAVQNPLYRNVLLTCDRNIIHFMGGTEKGETVFTRFEFEKEINCLKDFLKFKQK